MELFNIEDYQSDYIKIHINLGICYKYMLAKNYLKELLDQTIEMCSKAKGVYSNNCDRKDISFYGTDIYFSLANLYSICYFNEKRCELVDTVIEYLDYSYEKLIPSKLSEKIQFYSTLANSYIAVYDLNKNAQLSQKAISNSKTYLKKPYLFFLAFNYYSVLFLLGKNYYYLFKISNNQEIAQKAKQIFVNLLKCPLIRKNIVMKNGIEELLQQIL